MKCIIVTEDFGKDWYSLCLFHTLIIPILVIASGIVVSKDSKCLQVAADAAASPLGVLSSEESGGDEELAKAKAQADYYDDNLDDQDEVWIAKQRQGRKSDAVLSCPACFTSLCIDCQRHDKYVHQYRAMFVRNCRVVQNEILRQPAQRQGRRKGKKKRSAAGTDSSGGPVTIEAGNNMPEDDEVFKPVRCSVCDTEVAVVDKDEVYHFFNVMPSYS